MPFTVSTVKGFLCDPATEWLNTEQNQEKGGMKRREAMLQTMRDYSKYPKEFGQNTSKNNNNKPNTQKPNIFWQKLQYIPQKLTAAGQDSWVLQVFCLQT